MQKNVHDAQTGEMIKMDRIEMLTHLADGLDPLEVSIIKWEENRDTDCTEANPETCALCYTQPIPRNCSVCIVYKHTGYGSCFGTPYADYVKNPTRYNASRMIAFLKSLRY